MKKVIYVLIMCFMLLGVSKANTVYRAEDGWIIYNAGSFAGYRFGPSIIINSDGSIDMWTASPGTGSAEGEWDWIRHKNSTDGGHTWGVETIALKPTPGSLDAYSVCDPGVIKFGGYYYIGYTSTTNPDGYDNNVYVARSLNPTSGFEKWNGSGWGGNPQPIIDYDGPSTNWGAGEPSFVVKDLTLYIYYTWAGQTKVVTADATNVNWPATMTSPQGTIERVSGEDSADVKYSDALGKFIAISVANRLSADSYILVRESTNGFDFVKVAELRVNLMSWSHSCGISGTAEGHIDLTDDNFIAYAYSADGTLSWGIWNTYLNPIDIIPIIEGDLNEDGYINFKDFAILAQNWLMCTEPFNGECITVSN